MSTSTSPAKRPTVLVVDDTSDNLSLMAGLLRDLYRVQVSNSGEKALKLLQTGALPDLILLDIMMPDLSGHEVYACGAPVMVAAARHDFVAQAGLPDEYFYADAFTSAADKA